MKKTMRVLLLFSCFLFVSARNGRASFMEQEELRDTVSSGASLLFPFTYEGQVYEMKAFDFYTMPSSVGGSFIGKTEDHIKPTHGILIGTTGIRFYEGNRFYVIVKKREKNGAWSLLHQGKGNFLLKEEVVNWCKDQAPVQAISSLSHLTYQSDEDTRKAGLKAVYYCGMKLLIRSYLQQTKDSFKLGDWEDGLAKWEDFPKGFRPLSFDEP